MFGSLLTFGALLWAMVWHTIGAPGPLHGPWTLETMAALKRTELSVYFFAVIGVPLASVALAWALTNRFLPSYRPVLKTNDQLPTPAVWKTVFFYGVVPVLLYVLLLPLNFDRAANLLDDGLRLAAWTQIQHGAVPYRDVFFQYGFGWEILEPASAFALFGSSLASYYRWESLLTPLGGVAAYGLLVASLRRKEGALLFVVLMVGRSHVSISHRMALSYAALTLAIGAFKDKRPLKKIIGAGAVTALGFLYSLEGGLLLLPAIFGVFLTCAIGNVARREALRLTIKEAGYFCAGLGAVFIPFLVWIAVRGGLARFLENEFLIGSTLMSAWGKPTPIVHEPLLHFLRHPFSLFDAVDGVWIRWWFPALVFAAGWAVALRGLLQAESADAKILALLSLTGLFFFVITLVRTDQDHWLKATGLFWVFAVFLLERSFRFIGRRRFLVALPAAALLAFCLRFVDVQRLGQEMKLVAAKSLPARINLSSAPMKSVFDVTAEIKKLTSNDDPIFVFGNRPIYYYTADRVNPTRYADISYVVGPTMEQEALGDLRRRPPALVLAVSDGAGGFLHKPYHQRLNDYIAENYRRVDERGDLIFLTREAGTTSNK